MKTVATIASLIAVGLLLQSCEPDPVTVSDTTASVAIHTAATHPNT